MKYYFLNCLLILTMFFTTQITNAQSIVNDSVKIQGTLRHFSMYLPVGLKENAPLVFVLHGYNSKAPVKTWMNDAADAHKFALCIPIGLKDPKGKYSWNVGYPFQAGWKIDDVKTMCEMAKIVQKKYKLSKNNTFLTGMSNGGEMCYLLAYSNQTTFKALAPIAGLTLEWMLKDLEGKRPIPLFEVHGTKDHTSEWFGDLTNKGGWGAYLPVPIAVNYWVGKDRCTQEAITKVPGLDPQNGHYIIQHKFTGGTNGCEVWLYEVVGAPHCWHTGDLNTGEEVWTFFSKYLK